MIALRYQSTRYVLRRLTPPYAQSLKGKLKGGAGNTDVVCKLLTQKDICTIIKNNEVHGSSVQITESNIFPEIEIKEWLKKFTL